MSPDLINASFELIGALLIIKSVTLLHRQKQVRGISTIPVTFFCSWGYWNLFYYPHMRQWLSLTAGIVMVVINTIWLVQVFYYLQQERKVSDRPKDDRKCLCRYFPCECPR